MKEPHWLQNAEDNFGLVGQKDHAESSSIPCLQLHPKEGKTVKAPLAILMYEHAKNERLDVLYVFRLLVP
jgi:hypothetical protein